MAQVRLACWCQLGATPAQILHFRSSLASAPASHRRVLCSGPLGLVTGVSFLPGSQALGGRGSRARPCRCWGWPVSGPGYVRASSILFSALVLPPLLRFAGMSGCVAGRLDFSQVVSLLGSRLRRGPVGPALLRYTPVLFQERHLWLRFVWFALDVPPLLASAWHDPFSFSQQKPSFFFSLLPRSCISPARPVSWNFHRGAEHTHAPTTHVNKTLNITQSSSSEGDAPLEQLREVHDLLILIAVAMPVGVKRYQKRPKGKLHDLQAGGRILAKDVSGIVRTFVDPFRVVFGLPSLALDLSGVMGQHLSQVQWGASQEITRRRASARTVLGHKTLGSHVVENEPWYRIKISLALSSNVVDLLHRAVLRWPDQGDTARLAGMGRNGRYSSSTLWHFHSPHFRFI